MKKHLSALSVERIKPPKEGRVRGLRPWLSRSSSESRFRRCEVVLFVLPRAMESSLAKVARPMARNVSQQSTR